MKKCILIWLCLTAIILNGLADEQNPIPVSVGKFYLIANQLNNSGNTLADVFGTQLPTGSAVFIWACCDVNPPIPFNIENCYHVYFYDTSDPHGFGPGAPVWYEDNDWDPAFEDITLAPGQGAFIMPGVWTPSAPFSLIFSGTHIVPQLPADLPCGCGHWNLLSRQTDDIGTYENVTGRAPAEGAQVLRWNVALQNFMTYTFFSCAWTPSEPILDVGEAGFFLIPCAISTCSLSPPAGMSAWWPFDETAGPTANDLAGTVNNLGTYQGSPTPVAGMVSNALFFNGTSDFVLVTNQAEINFIGSCTNGTNGAESFTINSWIRANTNGPLLQTLLDKRVNPSSPIGYHLYLYNGCLGFQIADGTSYQNHNSPSPDLRDGQWHFIAVTMARCGTNGNAGTFYVDGSVFTFLDAQTGDLDNSADLQIGRREPAFGTNYYAGCIDELEIYKRALTPLEIEKIFYAGSVGQCKTNCNCNCATNLSYTVTISNCCTLIANQLDKPGGNTLANIMPSLPCDSRFMKYDNASSTWITTTYSTATGWADGSITLNPGEGAFLCPCCTNGYTITFTGCPHPDGTNQVSSVALVSRYTNDVGTYESITKQTPPDFAMVWKWDCGGYTGYIYFGGDWYDQGFNPIAEPTAAVGEAMWLSPSGDFPPAAPQICCPTNSVSGVKFNDLNRDGIWETNEPVVANVTINAYDQTTNLVATATTDSNGHYQFNLPCGTYTFREGSMPGWEQTCPSNGCYVVTVGSGSGQNTNVNFGNSTNCVQINCITNIVICSATNVVLTNCPVTAVDICSNGISVPVTSIPPFPHTFLPGVKTVSCWAGNASCTFTVTVVPPQPLVLFNTGVDDNHNLLDGGNRDYHYELGVNPDGESFFVVVDTNAYVMQAWLADSATSQWISPRHDGTGYAGANAYAYQVKFTLLCTNNVIITGRWAADNSGSILLNTNLIADPAGTLYDDAWTNFSSWHSFTITSGFVAGENILDFWVTNSSDYTGLRVELSGTECCCSNVETFSGYKFIDLNTNGVWETNEPVKTNWTINVFNEATNLVATTTTSSKGYYRFTLPCGTYIIKEGSLPGWVQTAPTNGCYLVTVGAGQNTNLNFGNYFPPATGGQVSITNTSWNPSLRQMTFSWPTSPVAWYLQGTTNLITGPWITPPNVQLNICNAWNIVDIPIVPTNNMFFRLVHTNTP
jgi:hypothetical protein